MATLLTLLLALYVLVSLVYWLWQAWAMGRSLTAVPRLGQAPPRDGRPWPRLSVVVPACNEADKIDPAARSLLAQDYPDLELVFVDDRSTDATGALIDRLATEDRRIKAIHIADLPEGWLGKVHALDRGLRETSGDFVLFTDADVHFRPDTLRAAVAYAEAHGLDHLAALPNLWPAHLVLNATISLFIRQFLASVRPWAVGRPGSRAYVGIGAFNLVRRTAFETTEGFAWLRMEPADDMALGLLMTQAGAKSGVVSAFDHLGLHWHRSMAEAARSAERGWASVSRFSLARTFVVAFAMTALELAPLATLAPLGFDGLRPIGYAGIAVFLAYVTAAVLVSRWVGAAKLLPTLLAPLTAPLCAAIFIRGALRGRRQGGIVWRGRLYPTEALRQGARLRFP